MLRPDGLKMLSENHLLYREDKYAFCTGRLQLVYDLPEMFLVENGMD